MATFLQGGRVADPVGETPTMNAPPAPAFDVNGDRVTGRPPAQVVTLEDQWAAEDQRLERIEERAAR
jgi:hypothetical protein